VGGPPFSRNCKVRTCCSTRDSPRRRNGGCGRGTGNYTRTDREDGAGEWSARDTETHALDHSLALHFISCSEVQRDVQRAQLDDLIEKVRRKECARSNLSSIIEADVSRYLCRFYVTARAGIERRIRLS